MIKPFIPFLMTLDNSETSTWVTCGADLTFWLIKPVGMKMNFEFEYWKLLTDKLNLFFSYYRLFKIWRKSIWSFPRFNQLFLTQSIIWLISKIKGKEIIFGGRDREIQLQKVPFREGYAFSLLVYWIVFANYTWIKLIVAILMTISVIFNY